MPNSARQNAIRLKNNIRKFENFHRVKPATITINNHNNTVSFELDTETVARTNETYQNSNTSPIRPKKTDTINWDQETDVKHSKLNNDELADTNAQLQSVNVKPRDNAKPTLIREKNGSEKRNLVSAKSKTTVTVTPGDNEMDDNKVWRALNNVANTHAFNPEVSLGKRSTKNPIKKGLNKIIPRSFSKALPFKKRKTFYSMARVNPYGSHVAKFHSDRPIMNNDTPYVHTAVNVIPALAALAGVGAAAYFGAEECIDQLGCEDTCNDFFTCSCTQSQLAGYYAASGDYGTGYLMWHYSDQNESEFWNGCIFGTSMNLLANSLGGAAYLAADVATSDYTKDKSSNLEQRVKERNKRNAKENREKIMQDLEKSVRDTGFDIKGIQPGSNIEEFVKEAIDRLREDEVCLKGESQSKEIETSRSGMGPMATNARVSLNSNWNALFNAELKASNNQQERQAVHNEENGHGHAAAASDINISAMEAGAGRSPTANSKVRLHEPNEGEDDSVGLRRGPR